MDKIEINGITYVPESTRVAKNGKDYVLVRSYGAGVHIGFLREKRYEQAGTVVILEESRNIFYWNGAAGISQIAELGVTKPEDCKITIPVSEREISNVIEIIPISKTSKDILDKIQPWKR